MDWDQPRHSSVKFDIDQLGDEDENLDDDSDPLISNDVNVEPVNFVRHDTPHPKELKARHLKLFANRDNNPLTSTEVQQQEPQQTQLANVEHYPSQIESNVDSTGRYNYY